jgi:hypothetical protein
LLKGVLVAFGIMLASLAIPVVHYLTGPVGPFVAGFVGGSVAKADEGRIIWFGLVVAGLMLIPAAILLAVGLVSEGRILGVPASLLVVLAALLVPYAWFGVTVGALISYLMRSREARSV